MREIDGSYGEGGGQLLRLACALAAITGEPVRVRNIRAHRRSPGLAAQHAAAVRAVALLCGGEVEGAEVGSPDVAFRPGARRGGEFTIDVGTAGSVMLVLQALLPLAITAPAPTELRLIGGTDIRAAPPADYVRFVLLPLLAAMGARVEFALLRRGYYPRGGGEVLVRVQPGLLSALVREASGVPERIEGVVHSARLPAHVAERMERRAVEVLRDLAPVRLTRQQVDAGLAFGPGGGIALWTAGGPSLLGAAEVAQRGVPAERIAETAARALRDDLEAGATLDIHASDQVLIYASLARGRSCFIARALTSHAATALWLLQRFLPLDVRTAPAGTGVRVEIEPRAR